MNVSEESRATRTKEDESRENVKFNKKSSFRASSVHAKSAKIKVTSWNHDRNHVIKTTKKC